LLKAFDVLKDQTFFLSQIESSLFNKILFPIGSLKKSKVKKIAESIGLQKITKKPSSAGICFVGKRKFSQFINSYMAPNKGLIIDLETNQILDEHNGIFQFTIGQRIPVDQKLMESTQRYFVAHKDLSKNLIFVVT
jgi:tRNA U34 2-thiouridine synthase MnmA/TrmU